MAWRDGKRGEWYVVAQVILFLVILLGPRPGWRILPDHPAAFLAIAEICGGAFMLLGTGFILGAAAKLGSNLTPFPRPGTNAALVTSGPFKFVRHPIYSGLVFAILGWGMITNAAIYAGYAFLALAFFDIKSRREELWLADKFPGYPAYKAATRKFIPFVY